MPRHNIVILYIWILTIKDSIPVTQHHEVSQHLQSTDYKIKMHFMHPTAIIMDSVTHILSASIKNLASFTRGETIMLVR